ncbi:hypothetical protein Tco_0295392 [Tanacetum coccineum]
MRSSGRDASAKLTRAKLNKRSGDADLSKDKSGPESPLEFWRSCPCEGPLSLKGHIADNLYQERAPRLCLVANPNWYKGRAHFLETEDTTPFRTILYILRIYLMIILGDEGLFSRGIKLDSIFITTEVNSSPSGFVTISPVPKPSAQDDPSINRIHGSGSSSSISMGVSRESSSGRSTMKSA